MAAIWKLLIPFTKLTKPVFFSYAERNMNIVIKHFFIWSNPYIYNSVVQELYNRDRSPEVDDVEGLTAAATKHLELLKQKGEVEGSFIIENIVGNC